MSENDAQQVDGSPIGIVRAGSFRSRSEGSGTFESNPELAEGPSPPEFPSKNLALAYGAAKLYAYWITVNYRDSTWDGRV